MGMIRPVKVADKTRNMRKNIIDIEISNEYNELNKMDIDKLKYLERGVGNAIQLYRKTL